MLRQITITRDRAGAGGNIHFNMTSLVRSTDALANRLQTGPYAQPALVPASPWLSARQPPTPQVTVTRGSRTITLRIAADRSDPRILPRWWLIRARYADGWRAQVSDARSNTVTLTPGGALELPDFFVVTSIDRAGVESAPVRFANGVQSSGQR